MDITQIQICRNLLNHDNRSLEFIINTELIEPPLYKIVKKNVETWDVQHWVYRRQVNSKKHQEVSEVLLYIKIHNDQHLLVVQYNT